MEEGDEGMEEGESKEKGEEGMKKGEEGMEKSVTLTLPLGPLGEDNRKGTQLWPTVMKDSYLFVYTVREE
ncbi:hypothetical protein Pmani_035545 [Petrolisthes manimaculis]|uniref:Uncharacterized protein n=1 Tax=Petrolisthes manimaculis TaxID=1843537 RepID=A0AAE1NM65_9EUCA|nr:hypothetical protein Pmani_035545 [Petrolisthes manimaculis]